MKNKIILDGKEYELSDDLAMRIKVEVDLQELERLIEKDPFARMRSDDYYFITAEGCVFAGCETRTIADDERYEAANYCRDKKLMEQRALHERLNRLLWRYSEGRGGGEKRGGYFIYRSNMEDSETGSCHLLVWSGAVFVKTAIEQFGRI